MEYTISITNPSQVAYTFIIYQKLPDTKTCTSVVWMMGNIPASTGVPTPILVTWAETLSVALGEKTDAKITQTSLWDVDLHTRWLLQYDPKASSYFLTEITAAGTHAKNDISVENRTGKDLNIGIALSEIAGLYWENVLSNEKTNFKMEPTFNLALFLPTQVVEIGQIVETNDTDLTPGAVEPKDFLAVASIDFSNTHYYAQTIIETSKTGNLEIHVSYPA